VVLHFHSASPANPQGEIRQPGFGGVEREVRYVEKEEEEGEKKKKKKKWYEEEEKRKKM
jgi:hypothetical protein